MVNKSGHSSLADLPSLANRTLEAMSRSSILVVCTGSLEWKFSSNITRIEKLELQLASKNSDFNADMVELELTKRRLRFAEEAASPMQEQVQSQWPQIRKGEAAYVSAGPPEQLQSSTSSRLLL